MSSTIRRFAQALALGSAVLGAMLATGCASSATTLRFQCDREVNGGTLLTVDVVRGSEADVRRIRELGEKWFYDSSRSSLGDRIRTVTFPTLDPVTNRCESTVQIPAPKEDSYLVVVADYKYESTRPNGRILVFSKKEWKGKNLAIGVHDKDLSQEKR